MRVLVAGGAGFVGSHLVDLLLAGGHRVVVVDNMITGGSENLAHHKTRRLSLVRTDVSRAPHGRFDRVYHLASPASPEAYGRFAIRTLLANALGTRRLLEIARVARAKFLLASTSEVYGDPTEHPQAETYWGNVNPIGPRSQYDEGKRFAEALTVAYVREKKVDARIVRIFNSYGPRMRVDDGRMPSSFIAAALRGDPIPVHGDGMQTRSLCFVGDTASGLIAAMERGDPGEVYNIGRSDEMTVLEFARQVRRAVGSGSRIEFVPGRPEDIKRRRPDGTKAKRQLGWAPATTLAVGLKHTVAWYRTKLGITAAV
ncbi:MAG: GDP-mannose 4,6-dehydratase [Chloroflexota bacterium]|nr:GDP-mannose 4,6-dehydratase [Chloroflexota bacterium]